MGSNNDYTKYFVKIPNDIDSFIPIGKVEEINFERDGSLSVKARFAYPEITKVIFSGPATIVFFDDHSKIVLKCSEDDIYDPEKAIMIAYMRKLTGMKSTGFSKWIRKMVDTAEGQASKDLSLATPSFVEALTSLTKAITGNPINPSKEDE